MESLSLTADSRPKRPFQEVMYLIQMLQLQSGVPYIAKGLDGLLTVRTTIANKLGS